MAVETPNTGDDREYIVQMKGTLTVGELRDALADVDPGVELHSFQIGFNIEPQSPVALLPQGVQSGVKELDEYSVPDETETETEPEGEEEAEEEDTETDEDEPETDGDTSETTDEVEVPENPTPEDLDLENPDQYEYVTLQKAASSAGIKGNLKRDQMVSELQEHASGGQDADERSVPLRPGHDPYYVMRILQAKGGWTLTDDIKSELQDDWDVNEDTVVNVLWKLQDRGFVEKREYEADKRKNEYSITDDGEGALEESVAVTDNDTEIEIAA